MWQPRSSAAGNLKGDAPNRVAGERFLFVHLTCKKGKTKENKGSSSYGVKRVSLWLWSGCVDGAQSWGETFRRYYGLVRSPPTASLRLGCLPRPVGAWSLRGLSRLPPPGDPNVRDCPVVLDACSCAAVLNGTYLPQTTCPRSWRGSTSPGWIGVATN